MANQPPSYPDDLLGALEFLTDSPGSHYYDVFASSYPSTEPKKISTSASLQCSSSCRQLAAKCEEELVESMIQSQRFQNEIYGGKQGDELSKETIEGPKVISNRCEDIYCNINGHLPVFNIQSSRTSVSRCGAWDTLGPSHSWGTGYATLRSGTSMTNDEMEQKRVVIATKWEKFDAVSNKPGVLAAMEPIMEPSTTDEPAIVFKSMSTTITCAEPGSSCSLTSIVDGSQLHDVLIMPPRPDQHCPDESKRLFDLALGLDSRSAFTILLASDHINITEALFRGRSRFYSAFDDGRCVATIEDKLYEFIIPETLHTPKQKSSLPPKLSGAARDPSMEFSKAVKHVGAQGCIRLPTPFSFTIGYDVGMYGPNIGSVFANLDTSFLYDYSVGVQNPKVKAMLQQCFPNICKRFDGGTLVEGCVSTAVPIIWSNYEALNYKTRIEDSIAGDSQPCAIIWKSLPALAAYRLVDGAFMHAWYDSDMSAEATAISGLGLAIHDLFDLSADLKCGEVANVVPTLIGGDLSLPSLAALYSRLGAILRWYGTNMPDDPAALTILLTFWWQLGNMRHRITQAACVVDDAERTKIPRVTTINNRPRFEDFVVGNFHDSMVGLWQSPQDHVALPDMKDPNLTPELAALVHDFVLPYGAITKDFTAKPPPDHICAAKIMVVLSMGLNSAERVTMWSLTSYLWDSGACWVSLLGTLCYRHQGRLNDDRARANHTSDVWLNDGLVD